MHERPRLGEILVAAGIIDDLQLSAALGEQARWGRRLGVTLIKMGMVEEGHLIRALAKQLDLPVASLAGKRISDEVIALVPGRVASEHCVIPLFTKKNGNVTQLFLGMEDPSNFNILDDLSFRTGMEIHPVMVGPSELGAALDRYYHGRFGTTPSVDPFHKARQDYDVNASTLDSGSLRMVTDDAPLPGTEQRKPMASFVRPAPAPAATPAVTTTPAQRPLPVQSVPAIQPAPALPEIELSDRMERLPAWLLDDVAVAISETERTRIVAKAIAQLLIQKGILTLDELQTQIADVKAKAASEASA